MNPDRLAALLGDYAIEHPDRPLRQIGAIEFAAWYHTRGLGCEHPRYSVRVDGDLHRCKCKICGHTWKTKTRPDGTIES